MLRRTFYLLRNLMINLIFYSIRIMGNTNQTPLTQAVVKRMIADGLDKYTTGCAKVMAATLVRADGTVQELVCTGRARTFWLLIFGIASTLIYAMLLIIGGMGSSGIKWNMTRDGKPAPGEEFFIYCGVGFFLSVLTVVWSASDTLGESWGSNVYGEKTLFAKMNAYIKWGNEKKKEEDKSFNYEGFQPCNTRRTPADCIGSTYTEVVLPRTKEHYEKLPQKFKENNTFVGVTNNVMTVKNGGELIEHKLMYVERTCLSTDETITTSGKKSSVFKCDIKENNNVVPDNVVAANVKKLYDKNLKLLPCNRRQNKNICENLKESGDGIMDKDCRWSKDTKSDNNICKKKWKPLTGADIWGCDECDDLSELCTLSDRTMYGAIVFIVCGIIMIIAGVEFDTTDDEYEDIAWLPLTCYICGTVILLVGFIYTALSIMCPAGSDMFGQGVQDGGFYQTLWWITTFGGRLQ